MPRHEDGPDETTQKPNGSEKRIPPDTTWAALRQNRSQPSAESANCHAANGIQDQEDRDENGGNREHTDILPLRALQDFKLRHYPRKGRLTKSVSQVYPLVQL